MGNEHGPMDQDSRTSFPDKGAFAAADKASEHHGDALAGGDHLTFLADTIMSLEILLVGNGAGGPAPPRSTSVQSGSRKHVVVEPEHVGRVVGLLDGCQAIVALRAVNRRSVGASSGARLFT